MHESPVQKPDWLGEKKLLSLICLYIELFIKRSNILLQTEGGKQFNN